MSLALVRLMATVIVQAPAQGALVSGRPADA